MNTLLILSQNLRRLRLSKGLTQQVFAEQTGLDYKYYQELESNRLKGLTLATVEKLAEFHGIEFWKLFHPEIIAEPIVKRARAPKIDR